MIQCPSCAHFVFKGTLLCRCGKHIRPDLDMIRRIKAAFHILKAPYFRTSVVTSRGYKHEKAAGIMSKAVRHEKEGINNGRTEVNLEDKFEMSQQCAPTRMTTRPFCTGALHRCLRDATRGRCESGARSLPQRQGRLHWLRGPVNQKCGHLAKIIQQQLQQSGVRSRRRATRKSLEGNWPSLSKRPRRQSRIKVYGRDGLEALGNMASQNVSGARCVAAAVPRTGQCRQ